MRLIDYYTKWLLDEMRLNGYLLDQLAIDQLSFKRYGYKII